MGRSAEPVATQESKAKATAAITTIAVSKSFAEALKAIAKSEETSVAVICDRDHLPAAAEKAAPLLAQQLASMQQAITKPQGA